MIKQTDARKRGRASRNKGADAERELAKILSERCATDVRRGQVFNHEPDLVGLDRVHGEVKRQERLNIHEAMKQSIDDAKKRGDGIPVVFFRRDREEWFVCMKMTDWTEFYNAWRG